MLIEYLLKNPLIKKAGLNKLINLIEIIF